MTAIDYSPVAVTPTTPRVATVSPVEPEPQTEALLDEAAQTPEEVRSWVGQPFEIDNTAASHTAAAVFTSVIGLGAGTVAILGTGRAEVAGIVMAAAALVATLVLIVGRCVNR